MKQGTDDNFDEHSDSGNEPVILSYAHRLHVVSDRASSDWAYWVAMLSMVGPLGFGLFCLLGLLITQDASFGNAGAATICFGFFGWISGIAFSVVYRFGLRDVTFDEESLATSRKNLLKGLIIAYPFIAIGCVLAAMGCFALIVR